MARKYLLSIDGGGIRGILPATALVKLEQATGKPVRETFSFVAGTSTGALMTAAIAAGVPAVEILNVYLNRTKQIFSPGPPWNNLKRVATGSMYSSEILNRVVSDTLGTASHWKLNDSPVDVLITAKRVSDGKPWYFVRDNARNSGCTGGLRLADCVTASAAAPTYFQPWTLPDPVGTLVDGGVGVTGNPVYQACVEAFRYSEGYLPEETTVVTFGTGRYNGRQNPHGLMGWLDWVLDELLRSPEEQQTEITGSQCPGLRLHRFDYEMAEDIAMDDTGSLAKLKKYGEEFVQGIDWSAILQD